MRRLTALAFLSAAVVADGITVGTLKGLLSQYQGELRKAYAGEMQGPPIGEGGAGR